MCIEFAILRRIWSKNWKLNTLRIYSVELAAKLETGPRLLTGEYTPPDTTQLDSTCSVLNFSTKSVGSRRELVANSIHTVRCRRDSTRQLSHVGVARCVLSLRHILVPITVIFKVRIKYTSCQKSRQILDIFSLSQILCGGPTKNCTHIITLSRGTSTEKSREDTPASAEVIEAPTMNFRANFKFLQLKFSGGPLSPLRCALA